jgi:hypothetical protein
MIRKINYFGYFTIKDAVKVEEIKSLTAVSLKKIVKENQQSS